MSKEELAEGPSVDQPPEQSTTKEETSISLSPLSNLDKVEQEQNLQMSKLKKAKEQINIEGNLKILNKFQGHRDLLACKYNEEFDYIAGGFIDGLIRVYKSNTGQQIAALSDKETVNARSGVTCIKHRHLSKLYPITNCFTATYGNGVVKCWNYHFNQCIYTIREKRQTYGIEYHPVFPKMITFGDDFKINFYDEETRTQERILVSSYMNKQDGHTSRVFAAVFHPKNYYEFISGGWDDTIQFWDLRQPYAVRHITGCHMCGEGLDINSRGNEILAASYQITDSLLLFDYASGRKIARLEPDIHQSKLYCGKYIFKDFIMTGGAEPHLVRIVDLQSTANVGLISGLGGGVYSMDIGPTKKQKEKKEYFADEVQVRMKSDLTMLPRIAFVSGNKIYQIEFY